MKRQTSYIIVMDTGSWRSNGLAQATYSNIDYLEGVLTGEIRQELGGGRKLAKRAKRSSAAMTGILVTKFKMGQIKVEDLEADGCDTSRAERCSAAKNVLEAVMGTAVDANLIC